MSLPRSRRLAVLAPALLAAGATGFLLSEAAEPPFDLLIRNARIVDGSGGPSFRGDIGVRDGRIARIGRLGGLPALRVFDADGRVAAPGFIDIHVHVEETLPDFPDAQNLIADGVTTIVSGNCGASAPQVGTWLARMAQSGTAVNVGTFYGHNTAREQVMGYADRPSTSREKAEMEWLVRRAMEEGALGLSSGLIYPPGLFSKSDEVIALARAAGESGGIYATHMRSENDRVFESIEESLDVARQARVPLEISHLKVTSPRLWGSSSRMLALVEAARAEGLDVTVDQYPYAASSSGLEVLLPDWALGGGKEGERRILQRRLANARIHRRIGREMFERLHVALGHEDLSYAVVAAAPWEPSLEGKSLRQITLASSRTLLGGAGGPLAGDIETVLDLCARGASSGHGPGACGTQMVYHSMDEADVERIFVSPLTIVARDGGVVPPSAGHPHPRNFGTCARVLARLVREQGLVSLEEAVRKMTSLPAARLGLKDRGLLRPGFRADVVLFDPGLVEDRSTFEDPHHDSIGFDLVVVNGVPVWEAGSPTCARPGKILYGPGHLRLIAHVSRLGFQIRNSNFEIRN